VSGQLNLSFAHSWQAEILPARPAILPARHFVYPRSAEEVERGAMEVLVRPGSEVHLATEIRVPQNASSGRGPAQPFLATCALGFRDPAVPTGVWSAPGPSELCAVSGGYAYVIDTAAPEEFTMIEFRPVLEVRALIDEQLLLFIGHREIIAWGAKGQQWKTTKLSDEGITITSIENGVLHGTGWEMMTDKDRPFALDLRRGLLLG